MIGVRWCLHGAVVASIFVGGLAQTFSSCNPLTSGGCPPNPALGRAVAIDLTKGPSDLFNGQGNPTYDSNGVSFTVAKQGDAPQINSKFYIMFGKLEVSLKAATGAGIVSSVVLQSDVLDEIDWEWLGANPSEVQTNYFGKGQTTTYNRGAWHPDPNSQSTFKTYTIDWTADQIVWQIGGQTIRALRRQDAAAGQYPQTPMQVKIGAWSGGDPSNAPGTIEWARGPTDYSGGPYTMQVSALTVTDYSTGTQYVYRGQDGTWESIEAVGGKVNPSGSGSAVVVADAPAVTSVSTSMPPPYGMGGWNTGSTTLQTSATSTATTYPGLPSGWTVTSSGKVLPPSAAPTTDPSPSSSSPSSPVSRAPGVGAGGGEVRTAFDDRGFPTIITVVTADRTGPRSYDDRGFLITGVPTTAATNVAARVDETGNSSPTSTTSQAKAAALTHNGAVAGGLLAGLLGWIVML